MERFTIYHVNRVYMGRLGGLHGVIRVLHGGIDKSPCKLVYMGQECPHVKSIYMEELGFHHVNMLRLIYMGVLQTRHVDHIYMVLLCMHTFFQHTHTFMHTCIHAYMHTRIHAYMHTCIHADMHTCIHA